MFTSINYKTLTQRNNMKLSEVRKFSIAEVEHHIQEAEKQVKTWENNLKEWKEVLELLTPASQDKE